MYLSNFNFKLSKKENDNVFITVCSTSKLFHVICITHHISCLRLQIFNIFSYQLQIKFLIIKTNFYH